MSIIDKYKLDGKVSIVTGGARGLGRVFAEALAEAGSNLLLVDVDEDGVKEVAEKISDSMGGEVEALKVDVTSEEDVKNMVRKADDSFGKIDVIVNNAGVADARPATDMSLKSWKKVIDVNLTGTWLCSKKVAEYMIEKGIKGSMINVASGYGKVVDLRPHSSYFASKAGVIHLTKALSVEWGHHGIRVNAICPGWFPTEMGRAFHENEKWKKHMSQKIPLGRVGEFDDLKPVIVFIASEASGYITGHAFDVLGGPAEIAETVDTGIRFLSDFTDSDYLKLLGFGEQESK